MGTILATKPEKQSVSSVPRSLFLHNMLDAIEKKGISIEKIARESGLDRQLLRKLVRGDMKPSRSILQRLASAPSIGVTYKTLVAWCLLDDSLHYASENGIGL